MTNYECGRALVYIAEQIIKTFGKDFGLEVQELKQESAEPLIKDEKIRKAVRAWAEANDVEKVDYWNSDYKFQDMQGGSSINFEDNPIETESRYGNDEYTIDELCGKGENDGMY